MPRARHTESELSLSRVNRLLRPLRSKCAALTSATHASTDQYNQYTKSRITDYARATGKGGGWAAEDPPPLAVFDDPKKLEGRALDRRSMMNLRSCKLVHDVVRAWKNILQAALPLQQSVSTSCQTPSLASMCAAIVGQSMVGVMGTHETEDSESEGSDSEDEEESDADDAEMAAIQELYEAVPTRFRNWTLISHSLVLILSSCPHNPTLLSCLLDLSLSYRLLQESRSVLHAYLSLCVQPADSHMAPPLAHPSHTEFLKELSFRWSSIPILSPSPATPQTPHQNLPLNPHFSLATFVDVFVSTLANTQCHEAWTCKATARFARQLRQTDAHSYAVLCSGLVDVLSFSLPTVDDDRPERLALWLDCIPVQCFQADEDANMKITNLVCAAERAGLHAIDTTRLTTNSPMRMLQSALVCTAVECLRTATTGASSHMRPQLIMLLRSASQTATLDAIVGPCFDLSTSTGAKAPANTHALSNSLHDVMHRLEAIASTMREYGLARLEASLWSCAQRHAQRMKLSEGSDTHASTSFRQRLADARTAAAARRITEDEEIGRKRLQHPATSTSRPFSPAPEPNQLSNIPKRSLGSITSVPVHRPMRFQSASTTSSPAITPKKPRDPTKRRASRSPSASSRIKSAKPTRPPESLNANTFLLASLKTVSLKLLEHKSADGDSETSIDTTPCAKRSTRRQSPQPESDSDSGSDWSRDEALRGTKRRRSALTPRARPRDTADNDRGADIVSPVAKRKRGPAPARARASRVMLPHTTSSDSESEVSGSDWEREHGAGNTKRATSLRGRRRKLEDDSESGSDWAPNQRAPRRASQASGSALIQQSIRTRATSRRRTSEKAVRHPEDPGDSDGPSLSPVQFKSLLAQASRRRVSLRDEPPSYPQLVRRRRMIVLDSEDESGLDESCGTGVTGDSDVEVVMDVTTVVQPSSALTGDDALDLFMYE